MPANRRYDLGALWRWMQTHPGPVTARDIARHLKCGRTYAYYILIELERLGYLLAQSTGESAPEGGRKPGVYTPMDNFREK